MKVLPIFSASSRHRFPLRPIYAYVKTTRKGCAKIHIRHFTNTKGGAVVPTTKGVKMDLKMFNRLCKAKKLITEAYNKQLVTKTKAKKRRRVRDFSSTENCVLLNRGADTSAPAAATATTTTTTTTHDPHCSSCFNLNALTPKYPVYPAPTNSILYTPAHCDDNKDNTTTTILPSAIYPDYVYEYVYE